MEGALESFLNTAIVIDDAIGNEPTVRDITKVLCQMQKVEGSPSLIETASGVDEPKDDQRASNAEEEPLNVDFAAIANGFFQKGIICGLLNPQSGSEVIGHENLVKICQRADLIVIDWRIGNSGKTAASVLKALAGSGEIGEVPAIHQVAVYSDAGADEILSEMKEMIPDAKQLVGGFHINGMYGLLLKKKDVPEAELGAHIIEKLERQYVGVLPNFAFRGIASIRQNIKRVLGRFRPELDFELALHCLLTRDENDIREQLVELLTEEIKSVLEEDASIGTSDAVYGALGLQLALYEPRDDKVFWYLLPFIKEGKGLAFESRQVFSSLAHYLVNDVKDKEDSVACVFKQREAIEKIPNREALPAMLSALLEISSLKEDEVGGFAELMSSRAMYASRKVLQCGTIVRVLENRTDNKTTGTDYVCIMPSCDGRRLKDFAKEHGGCVPFLFWELTDKPRGGGATSIGLVLRKTTDGTHESYEKKYVHGKFRNFAKIISVPCNNQEMTFDKDGMIQFDGYEIKWLGQLKGFHAQRIMHYVGASLSKVGLMEDELLRRYASLR